MMYEEKKFQYLGINITC